MLSWYREEGRLRLGGQPGCRGPGAWKPAGELLIGGVGALWGASACVGGGGGLCRVAGWGPAGARRTHGNDALRTTTYSRPRRTQDGDALGTATHSGTQAPRTILELHGYREGGAPAPVGQPGRWGGLDGKAALVLARSWERGRRLSWC